jgi:hypothetical protein
VEGTADITDVVAAVDQNGGYPRKPIARQLTFLGSTVFSVRGYGPYSRNEPNVDVRILKGNDPTAVRVGSKTFTLLRCAGEGSEVRCFLSSLQADLSCPDGEELAVRLRGIFHAQAVHLTLRRDAWFISPDFPVTFRFCT